MDTFRLMNHLNLAPATGLPITWMHSSRDLVSCLIILIQARLLLFRLDPGFVHGLAVLVESTTLNRGKMHQESDGPEQL